MAKVYITSNDPMTISIYTTEEAVNTFGEDFLSEYGKEIPDELLNRYLENYLEFWNIQRELSQYV